ncbi:ammonium transporter [Streptomyces sp. LRa12]|uniref:ammonium transporter n=1 Tax=Streptomyces sp. LRa12 TaxID=2563107 RepID=UPI0014461BEC
MTSDAGVFYGGGGSLLWKQIVAVLAVGAFSFVLTWIIAKAVDVVVGFTDKEAYADVPGQEEERAYDFRTAERLDAPASPGRGTDRETLDEIRRLLREHREG